MVVEITGDLRVLFRQDLKQHTVDYQFVAGMQIGDRNIGKGIDSRVPQSGLTRLFHTLTRHEHTIGKTRMIYVPDTHALAVGENLTGSAYVVEVGVCEDPGGDPVAKSADESAQIGGLCDFTSVDDDDAVVGGTYHIGVAVVVDYRGKLPQCEVPRRTGSAGESRNSCGSYQYRPEKVNSHTRISLCVGGHRPKHNARLSLSHPSSGGYRQWRMVRYRDPGRGRCSISTKLWATDML